MNRTALSYAVTHALMAIVELLIEHVRNRDPQHGELLNAFAARPDDMHDHSDVLGLLCGCKSFSAQRANDLIYRNDEFSRAMIAYTDAGTPLHFAALDDSPEAAEDLLRNKYTRADIADDNEDLPIDIARRHHHQMVVDVLLNHDPLELAGEEPKL